MRIAAKLYDESWNFIRWLYGWSVENILLDIPEGFKGNLVIPHENGRQTVYELK